MGIKKILSLTALFIGYSLGVYADDYEDDIYYNPNPKVEQEVVVATDSYTDGTIINGRNVDEYNRFGGNYEPTVEDVGTSVSNGEDFVYTKQIQKFYNPTIVVDNSKMMEDILNNSYGNVDIIYNCGVPQINVVYSMNAYAAYPYYTYNPWYWNYTMGWGWNPYYDPFFSWFSPYNYYNYWWRYPYPGYYPPYPYPGYHPPHPYPGYHPHPTANWRPGGNSPHGPSPGWNGNTRPGGNGGHRVSGDTRHGSSQSNGNVQINNNNHRVSGVATNNNQRVSGGTTTGRQNNTTVNQNSGSRRNNTGVNNNNRRNTNNQGGYQRSTNTGRNSQGSFNQGGNHSGRGSGGSFGGGRSGGGHRGGGGHRR